MDMDRRQFISATVTGATISLGGAKSKKKAHKRQRAIPLLAQPYVTVYESPDPPNVYAYSPGIARAPSGRLIATMDQGGAGVEKLPGIKRTDGKIWMGKIYTSDDRGQTWTHRSDMPMEHARPFVAGSALYVLGQQDDLGIMRSDDWGDTWSDPVWLTQGQRWHQAPCNVHYTRGRVYLVMERVTQPNFPSWPVAVIAPVVLSAKEGDDLHQRGSWTFSKEFTFNQAIEQLGKPHQIGAPFYSVGSLTPDNPRDKRSMSPIGWLETNIVQFTDPDHVWYDATGHTFHLWMRAHTGTTNLAAIAKAIEADDGSISVTVERAPSGEPVLYVPCPGGQMKFHILQDAETKLFWLLSSQATDSMTRPDRLPLNRYNLPNNERHRLVLHFSKNCVDWCFAGRVADTGDPKQGRHYASMVIDGDDLHVLSRSGDARAKNAHDGNLITFHTVKDFRNLVY
ncbi:MAG: exo-alpha-sialidase [Candidatus Hydrogenedentes bacterium]|nr:exo-alpha-sialidase [Candidatus Hydrogenedentota bacterium]